MVISAGPAVNLVLAFVLLLIFFGRSAPQGQRRWATSRRTSPPRACSHPGDLLIAVDGKRDDSVELTNADRQAQVRRAAAVEGCKATEAGTLLVERDGRRMTVG